MLIHQALHGYSEGHNRIACSMQLSPIDDERMKVLSDWSGYVGGIDHDSSYITAYPLTDGKSFVVAKSWYAAEMNRPGCVWTHSLIINLDSIDEKFDFRTLQFLFRKPQTGYFDGYDVTLSTVEDKKADASLELYNIDLIPLSYLYIQLLKKERGLAYRVEDKSTMYQSIILMLLQYLPLQILSRISLCSGSSFLRKIDNESFNLQFTTSTGKLLKSAPEINGLQESNFNEGIIYISKSMLHNVTDTFELLRFFSKDIEDNPTKLCVLGMLLDYLDKAYSHRDIPGYNTIIELLMDAFPTSTEGKMIKRTFVSEKIASLFTSKDDYYIWACTFESESSIEVSSIVPIDKIHEFLSESSSVFISFMSKLVDSDALNSLGRSVLKNEASKLSESMQEDLAKNHWNLYTVLLSLHKPMLLNDYWISLPLVRISYILPLLKDSSFAEFKHWEKILNSCLNRGIEIPQNIMSVMYRYMPGVVSNIMDFIQSKPTLSLPVSIVHFCKSHTEDVLQWINIQSTVSFSVVQFIIRIIVPQGDTTRNAGSNLWRLFVRYDDGKQDVDFYLFMFMLSFNWKDELSLEMLRRSFYKIHASLSRDELSQMQINRIRQYMAELPVWQLWDNCKKLRKGVVLFLKETGYDKNILNNFTPSKKLNEGLVKIWNRP